MKFVVEIELENDAFHNGGGRDEVARILQHVANKINNGSNFCKLYDINGNECGEAKMVEGRLVSHRISPSIWR